MRWLFCLIVMASSLASLGEAVEMEAGVQSVGTKFWRVRSINKQEAMEWAITHLSFYDSAAADATPLAIPTGECTGHEVPKPTSCKIKSSTKEVPKEDADPSNPDTSAANLLPDTPHPVQDAFTDDDTQYWMANTKQKGEFVGVQFENPTDVKKIKIKVLDLAHAPAGFVVEESGDGDNWARAAEVTITKDWDQGIEEFSWTPKDVTPPGVFSIRLQKDPSICLGARPIPDPDEPDLISPKPIDFDTELELQRCSDTMIPQFWFFDSANGRLHNAASRMYIAQVTGLDKDGETEPSVDAKLSIGQCNGGCKSGDNDDKSNLWAYSDSSQGGFLRLKNEGWNNYVLAAPTEDDGEGGVTYPLGGEVTMQKCGENGNLPASLSVCDTLTNAQWEFMPMFNTEPNKKAINCGPYSHSHLEPEHCNDQLTAQTLCAKDKQCIAYNWVDGSATGDDKEKAWLCHELHDIHLKTENDDLVGWELGIRTGFAEDPYEEMNSAERKQRRLEEALDKAKESEKKE